jgi:hypothetical protein
MIDEYHRDFFIVLGYLAAPSRITKLDIETHPNNKAKVESRYGYFAREQLVEDDVNYYVWDPNVNKWGSELRIYFKKNSNIPADLQNMVVSPRFAGNKYNARINNNEFVWLLIKYGFRASNLQDENLIKSNIPSTHISDFDQGYIS